MSTHLPPACIETDSLLVEFAYGEESAVPASAKQHLATCDRCQAELRALQGVRDAASTLPMEEPSAELDANIFAALDAHLAGESVDSHLKLPDPQPTPARPKMTVLQGGAVDRDPAPPAKKEAPKRRRSWAPWAAAASVAVVASSTWLVTKDEQAPAIASQAKSAAVFEKAAQDEVALKDSAETAKEELLRPSAPLEEQDKVLPARRLDSATLQKVAEAKPKAAAPRGSVFGGIHGAGGDLPAPEVMAKADSPYRDSEFLAAAEPKAEEKIAAAKPMELPPPPPPPAPQATALNMASAAPPPAAPPPAPVAQEPMAMKESAAPSIMSRSPGREPVANSVASADSAESEESPSILERLTRRRESKREVERSAAKRSAPASIDEQAVWTHRMDEARAALGRSDWRWAEEQFASVLTFKSLPSAIRREALEGRLHALDALGRTSEADVVAELLTREFPASPKPQQRARVVPATK